jgi:hypothetical protein
MPPFNFNKSPSNSDEQKNPPEQLSRRDFLKKTVAVTAGIVASATASDVEAKGGNHDRRTPQEKEIDHLPYEMNVNSERISYLQNLSENDIEVINSYFSSELQKRRKMAGGDIIVGSLVAGGIAGRFIGNKVKTPGQGFERGLTPSPLGGTVIGSIVGAMTGGVASGNDSFAPDILQKTTESIQIYLLKTFFDEKEGLTIPGVAQEIDRLTNENKELLDKMKQAKEGKLVV